MPKYGVHGIVLSRAADALAARGTAPASGAAALLSAHPDLAALGAVGPDIFFWAPDYEIVRRLRNVQRNVVAAVDAYNRIVEPIRKIEEKARDAALALVDRLPPALVEPVRLAVEELQELSKLYRSAVGAVLIREVLGIDDFVADAGKLPRATSLLFDSFAPPLQAQMDEGRMHDVATWYWFDMLHYRRTGLFASHLVSQAAGLPSPRRDGAQAYAYGYLSHIAADVVGHAFVNRVVGAPYRLNVQRHVTAENFMDAWAYNAVFGGASASRDLLTHLPLPAAMPDHVAEILDAAFRAAYGDQFPTRLGNPGFLTRDQIVETYGTFHEVLQLLAKTGVARPEEPFPGANELLSELMNELMGAPSPPAPPGGGLSCGWDEILSPGATDRSRACFVDFLDRRDDWAKYLQERFLWTFETAEDMVDLAQAKLDSMPLKVFFALLYGAQLLLYGSFRSARHALAVYGFVTPEPDELGDSVALSLATTFLDCGAGPDGYPRRGDGAPGHLVCPSAAAESPATRPDVVPPAPPMDPVALVDDQAVLRASLDAYAGAATPAATRQLAAGSLRIGGASAMTRWMIETAADPNARAADKAVVYANWNLDSDRGYAYRTWNGTRPAGGTSIVPETYID